MIEKAQMLSAIDYLIAEYRNEFSEVKVEADRSEYADQQFHLTHDGEYYWDVKLHLVRGNLEYIINGNDIARGVVNRLASGLKAALDHMGLKTTTMIYGKKEKEGEIVLFSEKGVVRIIPHPEGKMS